MRRLNEQQFDVEWSTKNWERGTPLLRRLTMRSGLQSKLIFSFMGLMIVTLAVCCWTFLKMNRDRLTDLMGEQTREP
ncbi:MAG: hypothetical protein JO353_03165, partial [Phycisphaerae bacterium]|nr:hypothetical protein [Phycisphaerae bacterium]